MSDEDRRRLERSPTMNVSATEIALEQIKLEQRALREELDGVAAEQDTVKEAVEGLGRRMAHAEVRLKSIYDDERADSKKIQSIVDAVGASPDDATGHGGAGMRKQIASLVRDAKEHDERIDRTLRGIEAATKVVAACVAAASAVVALAVALRGCT